MIRIFFFLTAILFLGGGILSLFAAGPNAVPGMELVAQAATSPTIGSANLAVVAQTLTQNEHLMILVRMGFFYAGFICVLLAFDFGDSKNQEEANRAESNLV